MSHHTGYNILCRYSGVFLLVSAALIAAQSDQPTTISLAEKILLKIGKKKAQNNNLFHPNDPNLKFSASGLKKSVYRAGEKLLIALHMEYEKNIVALTK